MGDGFEIVVMDSATAAALSQILPLLLLTLMVELRRTALHRGCSRAFFAVFFFVFGVIETVLVSRSTAPSTRSSGAIFSLRSSSSLCSP
jgi:hypothetical protein